jgi:hypothetical protein
MSKYNATFSERTYDWLKNISLIWAAFLIISWSVERKAKRELRKLRGHQGILGRWRNYRRARRPGGARRSSV